MSYGSTFVQFDPNGKLSSRLSRSHVKRGDTERSHKLSIYEKEFDLSLSRVNGPSPDRSSVRDSMIAYSNKMKSIQDARQNSGSLGGDPLFVRAKHIPRHPARQQKKRRPMSFDELLGRDRESTRDRNKAKTRNRPHSDKQKPGQSVSKSDGDVNLPVISDRYRNTGANVHVSLVSASDLYELVDFSLKSKTSKAETLKMMGMEAENTYSPRNKKQVIEKFTEEIISRDAYERYERTQKNAKASHIVSDENDSDGVIPDRSYYEQMFSMDPVTSAPPERSYIKLPAITNDIFRRRPNRVKRMKLQDSHLGAIPEDNIIEPVEDNYTKELMRRLVSPPPQRRSPKVTETISKPSLDAILEQSERGYGYASVNNDSHNTVLVSESNDRDSSPEPDEMLYRNIMPYIDKTKTTKKVLIRDDGDVRIEATQCPPKQEPLNAKLKAQKRFKKIIYLRDGAR